MNITKHHPITGEKNTLDLDVTAEELYAWVNSDNLKIQKAFPRLNADEREFMMTGILPGEWDDLFPDE